MQPSIDVRSSPSHRFDTCAVPPAIALRRMARWEMDLSPGSLTSPSSRGVGLTVCLMALVFVPAA